MFDLHQNFPVALLSASSGSLLCAPAVVSIEALANHSVIMVYVRRCTSLGKQMRRIADYCHARQLEVIVGFCPMELQAPYSTKNDRFPGESIKSMNSRGETAQQQPKEDQKRSGGADSENALGDETDSRWKLEETVGAIAQERKLVSRHRQTHINTNYACRYRAEVGF